MRFEFIGCKKTRLKLASVSILLTLIIVASCAIGIIIEIYRDKLLAIKVGADTGNLTIILDAGHGGEDCGAIGKNGIYEKDLNLSITFAIGEILSNNGYTVVYTRTEDKLLYRESENIRGLRKISDLKNRVEIAENYENSIFISIHMNSFGDSKYSGLQVYYGTANDNAYSLASSVQKSVHDMLQPQNNRKVKRGKDIYLLENISAPAVLIECGFLSNAPECENLSKKEYQKSLSFAIVCGIIEYIHTNSV